MVFPSEQIRRPYPDSETPTAQGSSSGLDQRCDGLRAIRVKPFSRNERVVNFISYFSILDNLEETTAKLINGCIEQ